MNLVNQNTGRRACLTNTAISNMYATAAMHTEQQSNIHCPSARSMAALAIQNVDMMIALIRVAFDSEAIPALALRAPLPDLD
jgi:hypothetical protein